MEEYRRCQFCDELVRYNAIKCKHCGSILSDSQSMYNSNTPETQIKVALSSRYEILEEIGRGGMASVYKAIQKNLNRHIALKVIHQNLIYDNEFLQRFHQEAQLCASLSHPNIVTIYDEGAVNNVHYMAMEYLSGNDLQKIIKHNNNIIIEDVIKIIVSMANALDYSHSKGLIHRDIKSANIIITNEGRAVLTDFGIAFAANTRKLTQTGSVIGTPEYMSPEQAKGLVTDSRSDIYSLGIVMFECLTGRVPFTGDNPLTTIFKILNDKPPFVKEINKEVPQWLSSVVNKSLEKDPLKRFQTGKDFASALMNKRSVTLEISSKNKTFKRSSLKKEKNKLSGAVIKPKNLYNKYLYLSLFFVVIVGFVIYLSFPNKLTLEKDNNRHTGDKESKVDEKFPENVMVAPDVKSRQSFLNRAVKEFDNSEFERTIIIADSGLSFFPQDKELLDIKSKAQQIIEPPKIPEKIEVPSVVGLQLATAQTIIESNKLRIGSISKVYSSEQKGLVTNQIPGAGSLVNQRSIINLIVGE